jgi:type IV pilus assembly protein PilX
MPNQLQNPKRVQTGIVLVSSLLLLLVVTIMALSIFRSFGLQERIAGNTRDKQRALQVATSIQQYAEAWIANSSGAPVAVATGIASSADYVCAATSSTTASSMPTAAQICTNTLASLGAAVTNAPWVNGTGQYIGVQYTPPGLSVGTLITGSITNDIYFNQPAFYITDMGAPAGSLVPGAGSKGEVYKIDAYGSGVSPTTIAVVESTVVVSCTVCNLGAI